MYFNTKLGVHVTPVGVVLWEHRAGVKSNTRGVNFNTTVFAVYQLHWQTLQERRAQLKVAICSRL